MNATNFLIILNSILFFTTNKLNWGFVPSVFWKNMNYEAPNLLMSNFMHADMTHLIFNMLALYSFGTVVEKYMGYSKYIIFYFAASIIGTYIYALLRYNSNVMTIGASGAIASVIAIYFLMYRKTSHLMNVVYFELAGLIFGQLSGINYLSHLIGLFIGSVYYFINF